MGLSYGTNTPHGNQFKLSKLFTPISLEHTLYPLLAGNLYLKLYECRCIKRESNYAPKTIFNNQCIVTLTFDLLTPKPVRHILNSWGVFVWSFIITGVKRKQLCNINHFQLPVHCDLDLWPFDPKTYRAYPQLMGSLCMKFHDDRWKGKAIMWH